MGLGHVCGSICSYLVDGVVGTVKCIVCCPCWVCKKCCCNRVVTTAAGTVVGNTLSTEYRNSTLPQNPPNPNPVSASPHSSIVIFAQPSTSSASAGVTALGSNMPTHVPNYQPPGAPSTANFVAEQRL